MRMLQSPTAADGAKPFPHWQSVDDICLDGIEVLLHGDSAPIQALRRQIHFAAGSECHVLVTGTDCRSNLLAVKQIHLRSAYRYRPVIVLDSHARFESEIDVMLFGDSRAKPAIAVDHNVIILENVEDLPPRVAAKLALALTTGKFHTHDGQDGFVRARLLSTTAIDIAEAVATDRFRRDLLSLLSSYWISVPQLSEREEDIAGIAQMFLEEATTGDVIALSDGTVAALKRFHWADLAQLRRCIYFACARATGQVVEPEDLPSEVAVPRDPSHQFVMKNRTLDPVRVSLKRLERLAIIDAIHRSGGDKSKAAALLGIGTTTLYRKLRQLEILTPDERYRLEERMCSR